MRRRILNAVLAVVLLVVLLLGIPLAYTAYLFVEDTARRDLQSRLELMASEIIAQEGAAGGDRRRPRHEFDAVGWCPTAAVW